MNWYRVKSFPLSRDLSPLLKHLHHNGVLCRVTEERGSQCVWVADQGHVEPVNRWLQEVDQAGTADTQFAAGFQQEQADVSGFVSRMSIKLLTLLGHYPVTLITMLLGLAGFALMALDQQFQWVGLLTMQPLTIEAGAVYWGSLADALGNAEYWRLLTPIFLHFSVLHAAFNSLWIWEFGRRIERFRSSLTLCSVIALTGLASNLAQYLWSGPSLFGGLSGVLYGLMGFIWVIQMRNPQTPMRLQPGIIGFLLVWLVIGLTGTINLFIDGSIANAAHTAGLLSGMLLALFWQDPKLNTVD